MTSGNGEKRPASSAPVGEAACWLEGDDEIFTAAESARSDQAAPAIPGADSGHGAAKIAPEGKDARAGSSDRERLAELIVAGTGTGAVLHPDGEPCAPCRNGRAAADAILAAGWRLPLPDASDELNVLLGIDDVEKIYTQADLVDAVSRALGHERKGQTVEWGYRRVGEPDDLIRKASALQAQAAIQRDGFEVVYRVVKPWKADD